MIRVPAQRDNYSFFEESIGQLHRGGQASARLHEVRNLPRRVREKVAVAALETNRKASCQGRTWYRGAPVCTKQHIKTFHRKRGTATPVDWAGG